VSRLRDYGLPPFVINSAVLGVVAQRLVRRICSHCTGPAEVSELICRRFRMTDAETRGFVRGHGCVRCGQTGYRGRVGIYELLRFTPAIQQAVERSASIEQVRTLSVQQGMRMMWQDGLEKAHLGLTTLEEIAQTVSVIEVEGATHAPRLSA
jgi:type II secretory ATPase GspE/PulE/Tfp pilus assembly ATPase PilB-like protein